jgi:hypothetical protein
MRKMYTFLDIEDVWIRVSQNIKTSLDNVVEQIDYGIHKKQNTYLKQKSYHLSTVSGIF